MDDVSGIIQDAATNPALRLGILDYLPTSPDKLGDASAITEQDKLSNDKDTSYDANDNRVNDIVGEDSNNGKKDSIGVSNNCDRNYDLDEENKCVPAEDDTDSGDNADNNVADDKNEASDPMKKIR